MDPSISPSNDSFLEKQPALPFRWRCQGIAKRFATPVLRDVSLDVMPGRMLALLGANGAGKSTLGKIIAGLQLSDGGQMWLDDCPFAPSSKRAAERCGVHIVQQELGTIETLSIAENLFLNSLPARCGWIRHRQLDAQACEALRLVGLESLDPRQCAGELGVGEKQLIEIAAALQHRCRLLILDEPTAALTTPQIDRLFEKLRELLRDGVSMIYVSHRLDEIRRIADEVAVLRDGVLVERGPAADFIPKRAVAAMSGERGNRLQGSIEKKASRGGANREVLQDQRRKLRPQLPPPSFQSLRPTALQRDTSELALLVRGLVSPPRVHQVDLEVYRGEMVGIAGLVGAGRTETLRAIFGADRARQGEVWIRGNARSGLFRSPRSAVKAGLGLIPEDRKSQGLALPLAVRINVTLGSLGKAVTQWGRIRRFAERRSAEHSLDQTEVNYASIEQPIATLSGGNQQKVLVSRWLRHEAEVLLIDEPSRGIDVAAKQTLFRVLREKAMEGVAMVVVSSDLQELLEHCDVVAVMRDGRIEKWCDPRDCSESDLLAIAIGQGTAEVAKHDG